MWNVEDTCIFRQYCLSTALIYKPPLLPVLYLSGCVDYTHDKSYGAYLGCPEKQEE